MTLLGYLFGSVATSDLTDTAAFRRWFGDSQVLDANGRPLVVYHGTNAHAYSPSERIEVFGTNSHGGAFFSNDSRFASQYGERVYAVYLRLESPLVLDAAGRGWTDLRGSSRINGRITASVRSALRADQQRQRKAAEREADLLDDLFAELTDIKSEEPISKRGPSRTSIDPDALSLLGYTLSDLLRIAPDDALETDDVAKAARSLGFDGVIVKNVQDSPTRGAGYSRVLSDIYAVFSPTQIKSADRNNGEFDPKEPSSLQGTRRKKSL